MSRNALLPRRAGLLAITLAGGCTATPAADAPSAAPEAPVSAEQPSTPPAPLLAPSAAAPADTASPDSGSPDSGSPDSGSPNSGQVKAIPATSTPVDTRTGKQIQSVISDNRQIFRDCYEAALKDNPGIHGDLVVSFVIDPEGSVKHAEVNWSESEIHIPELDTCAVDALKGLRFAASSRGLESRVNYPFNFNPK